MAVPLGHYKMFKNGVEIMSCRELENFRFTGKMTPQKLLVVRVEFDGYMVVRWHGVGGLVCVHKIGLAPILKCNLVAIGSSKSALVNES